MVVEAWFSRPIIKESELTGNFCGLLRMPEGLSGD